MGARAELLTLVPPSGQRLPPFERFGRFVRLETYELSEIQDFAVI
jgi:hypothetical protein